MDIMDLKGDNTDPTQTHLSNPRFKELAESKAFPIRSLSYSAINTLETCPQMFFKRYILRLPEPPKTFKLLVGTAFDDTVNFNYSNKKIRGNDLSYSVLSDYAEHVIDSIREEYIFDDEGTQKEQIDTAKFSCASGIKEFGHRVFPSVDPLYIQPTFISKDLSVPFKGVVDVIDKNLTIIDNKTTWRKWQGLGNKWQHLGYAYLARKNGLNSVVTRYDGVLLKKKAPPEIFQISQTVSDVHLRLVEEKIRWAIRFIEAGMKDPLLFHYNTSSQLCGKYCSFVKYCQKELGVQLE